MWKIDFIFLSSLKRAKRKNDDFNGKCASRRKMVEMRKT